MRKIIGVMPLYDDKKESYWMLPRYLKMLEAENAIPMVLPLSTNHNELDYFLEICGGFLLTGGHDVSPSVHNEICGGCPMASGIFLSGWWKQPENCTFFCRFHLLLILQEVYLCAISPKIKIISSALAATKKFPKMPSPARSAILAYWPGLTARLMKMGTSIKQKRWGNEKDIDYIKLAAAEWGLKNVTLSISTRESWNWYKKENRNTTVIRFTGRCIPSEPSKLQKNERNTRKCNYLRVFLYLYFASAYSRNGVTGILV